MRRHVEALLADAAGQGVPDDVIGRLLLEAAIDIWHRTRSYDDIAHELQFMAENLDPDAEFAFIRP